eukprot:Transcript_29943.p1 GENE.Transcript_29943~~Transcript_29943.p1  ORF type:complete len:356 (-),score=139.68 Transcript_29943:320-1339(-)
MRRITAHWTRLALANAPSARSSHRLSAIDGRAYLFGGEEQARHSIDSTVHCLDVDAGSWTKIEVSASPPPRVAHAQAAINGKLIVFGGRSGVEMGEAELDDVWEFDPALCAWQPLDAAGGGSAPSPRSFHAATAVEDSFYVFGGCGAAGRMADLHRFDTRTRTWEVLPPPPEVAGRGGATLEASPKGDALWLAAGFAGHETNDLLRFCLRERTWERKPSEWLRPRSVCAAMALDDALMLFGGEVSPSDRGHEGAGGFASDLIALDPIDGTQQELTVAVAGGAAEAASPPARGWAAAAALSPREALLVGGLTGTDAAPERLDDAWRLRLDVEYYGTDNYI